MSSIPARITVHVHPGAPKNEVVRLTEGTWHLKVAAPPVEGKANRELVAFLSDVLGVSKGSISIVSGHTARHKVLAIDGLTLEEIAGRLLP